MIITKNGYNKYRADFERMKAELKKVRENKASAYILTGDTWHDNPYFKMVEQDEEQLLTRMQETLDIIGQAQVVDTSERNVEEVAIGSIFKFKAVYAGDAEPMEGVFEIVGYGENSIESGQITYESPVAKNLMGHKVNDVVKFDTPRGKVSYTILKFYSDWSEVD